jgi:hypothetical protein
METQHVDSFHKTGLSEQGFLYYTTELALDDVQFEAESDATDEPPKRGPKK